MEVGLHYCGDDFLDARPVSLLRRAQLFSLEVVFQGELHLSWARPYRRRLALDIAEAGRGDIADRIAEVRAVEDVIGISTEVNLLLMPDGEVLGDRSAVALESGCPFRRRT